MPGVYELVLFLIGSFSGLLAGLLGIGGAIVLIPMLVFFMPLLGYPMTMHEIMGLSMSLVFFASLTGVITHFGAGNLKGNLILVVGGPMLVGSFMGAIASKYASELTLLTIFAIMLTLSIAMLFKPKPKETEVEVCSIGEEPNINYLLGLKKKFIGMVLGLVIGWISGMIGIGGAATLIPALTVFLAVPIKVCVGTSLGIILAGGTAGFVGKAITGQIAFIPALFLALGGIIFSRMGSKLSMRLHEKVLKKLMIVVLSVTLIRVIVSLITF